MKDRHNPWNDILLILTEQLLLFPLTLFLLVQVGWGRLLYFYGPVLAFSVLVVIVWIYVLKRLRLLTCAAVFAANTLVLIQAADTQTGMALGLVLGTLFLIRSFYIIRNINKTFSFTVLLLGGITSYFLAAFVFNYYDLFKPYTDLLAIAATVTVIGVLFTMNLNNFGHQRRVADKISMISRSTRSTNILLLSLFSILVLFISMLGFIDHVWAFFLRIGHMIKNILNAIDHWIESLFMSGNLEEGPGMAPPQAPLQSYSDAFDPVKYYVGLALVSLFIAIVLYIVIKKMLRLLINLFVLLYRKFVEGQDGTGREYEDEISSLLKEGESTWRAARVWFSSHRDTVPSYRQLHNNVERVRWLYKYSVKKALDKGLSLDQAMTSTEVLDKIGQTEKIPPRMTSAACESYNSARYGSKIPTDAEMENMMELYSSNSPRV